MLKYPVVKTVTSVIMYDDLIISLKLILYIRDLSEANYKTHCE